MYKCQKIETNLRVFTRRIFTFPRILRIKFEICYEKQKKTNCYMNSDILSFCDTIYAGFVFFVSSNVLLIWL
jgi:hypothetical protein